MTVIEEFDVVVVGYGPTGLVLAAALGQRGHRVAVVERWPQLYGLPRLSHIDDETARIIQAVADSDRALRDSAPIGQYRFVNAAGELLTQVGDGVTWGRCGYPADISIFQPDIEDAIHERAKQAASVEHFLGWEAVSLDQDAEGVTLGIRQTGQSGSATRHLRSAYLVGSDGVKSFVREAVGITRTDFGFSERWLNVDLLILRPLCERFGSSIQYCDPARGHMQLPIGTRRLRIEVALLPGEDAASFTDEAFAWRWLRERHDLGPDDVQIIRQVVYTFEARSADIWRLGRVLLGGDACHTMPPYLGQGACSGMRDAIALDWRLDLVLRGIAGPKLLDSYETERKPHVTTITRMAIELGRIANEHDPERARIRDAALRAHPPAKPALPFISAGLLDPETPALAGQVAPQGLIRRGEVTGRFDDVVGRGFVLLFASATSVELLDAATRAAFVAIGGLLQPLDAFVDIDGTYAAFFEKYGIAGMLYRPDFIIFGTRSQESDLPSLVNNLLTSLGVSPVNALQGDA